MGVWSRLSEDLLELELRQPGVLVEYPNPRSEGSGRPYGVRLEAFAEDVAADLHARYGGDVELTVGALPYPNASLKRADRLSTYVDVSALPAAADLHVALGGGLVVRSGHHAHHHLRITNTADRTVHLNTTGAAESVIVDPVNGRTVGGWTRSRHLVLIRFTLSQGQVVSVPVDIGTESFDPALGYRVPPGEWLLVPLLEITTETARGARSKPGTHAADRLPFTITD